MFQRDFAGSLTRVLIFAIATLPVLTCSNPAEPRLPPLPPPPPPPPPITSIRIIAPASLIVHQTTLLEVRGETTAGEVTPPSANVRWGSSDTTVAKVSAEGV